MRKKAGKIGLGAAIISFLIAAALFLGINLETLGPSLEALGIDLASLGIELTPAAIATGQPPADWYEPYFTQPTCPPEEERHGGLDEIVAADLLKAKKGVDVATFDLDSEPIVDALIELEKKGLAVRVVTDSDNGRTSGVNRLRRNGISVPEDKRAAFMHDKFIIIDGAIVWTGSMNLTSNGVYCNNNNFVRIESSRIAANYVAEMDEMYEDGQFGPTSPDNALSKRMDINGVHVENYFGAEDEIAPVIAQNVATARDEILFLAFVFTSDEIGKAMIDRAKDGVTVRGVFESVGSDSEFSYFDKMRRRRLPNLEVRRDGNPFIMHHKVVIIDSRVVIFGSHNFTDSANDSNDENLLIIHDPALAFLFREEFERVWAQAGE